MRRTLNCCSSSTTSACRHIPLRLVLKGKTFSPLYFKTRHTALLDLQRQCGHPQIFKTMAPWEPSFPYHAWILNEMAQAGRRRGASQNKSWRAWRRCITLTCSRSWGGASTPA